MYKNNKSVLKLIILFLIIGLLFMPIYVLFNFESAYAQESTTSSLDMICEEMTQDFVLDINGVEQNISNYPNYLNERYRLDVKNFDVKNLADEWILRIIPIRLFKEKYEDYFYLGDAYGFYFDYDSSSNTYLIYLIKHCYCYESGNFSRCITPLYYEKYVFNENTEEVSLVYLDYYEPIVNQNNQIIGQHHYCHYQRYSDYEKIFLKDINFTGSLYNECHKNIGEDGYDAQTDKGGFFVGNQYYFSGVSIKEGNADFMFELFKIGIGYIPLGNSVVVGDAINIITFATELNKFAQDAQQDFRETVSNKDMSKYIRLENMYADEQIREYGNLLKNAGTLFSSDNSSNAVLFGINNHDYVTNIFTINYSNHNNKWNTRFSGKIALSIVKEKDNLLGSTVEEIAKVESNDWCYTLECGEKTELLLDEEIPFYILNDAKNKAYFIAPENGIYTLSTKGNVESDIISSQGEISNIGENNKRLVVNLKKGDNLLFDIVKKEYTGSHIINIRIEFTPTKIGLDESTELTIAPNQREFVVFDNVEAQLSAFDFRIDGLENGTLDILEKRIKYSKYHLQGKDIHGSIFSENYKYFIGIKNNTEETVKVYVTIDNINSLEQPSEKEVNILDKKIIAIKSNYNSGVAISANSNSLITLKLYDENNKLLQSSAGNPIIRYDIEKGKEYYLMVQNFDYVDSNVVLSMEFDATELEIGKNNIGKASKDTLYMFHNYDLEAEYNIVSNGSFALCDNDFNNISVNNDGSYTLMNNQNYYFILLSDVEALEVTVNINYLEKTTGTYNDRGFQYIKYVPSRTAAYKVNGVLDYSWYNSELQKCNAYLTSGNDYYLKIEGSPLEEFNVKITINRNEIRIGQAVNVYAGYYCFNVEETGIYKIRTFCTNGVSSTISLYSSEEEPLMHEGMLAENICADVNAYEIELNKGLYYINIKSTNRVMIGLFISKGGKL